jgi:hypothetical protein
MTDALSKFNQPAAPNAAMALWLQVQRHPARRR